MTDQANTTVTVDVDLAHRKGLGTLTLETWAAVGRAGIVVVPDDGFREYDGPVFPQGTVDFLQFLRDHAPNDTSVEIAADDANYKEVALHSDLVRLGTLFIEYGLAPVAASLIAAYLKDFLGSRLKRAEARTAIVVCRKDTAGEETLRISYEGPAENAESALMSAIANLPSKIGEKSASPPVSTPQGVQPKTPVQFGAKKKRKQRRK